MIYFVVIGVVDGKLVVWLEQVSDDQYCEVLVNVDVLSVGLFLLKQQVILMIVVVVVSSDVFQFIVVLSWGLDVGLMLSEIKEVFVQLYVYVGFLKSFNVLGELMEVVCVCEVQGVVIVFGQLFIRNVFVGEVLCVVGIVNQIWIFGVLVIGLFMDFVFIINQYLQMYLFGDIFECDNLDWQSCELVMVGVLVVMFGVEVQLCLYMVVSQCVGFSCVQLYYLVQLLVYSGYVVVFVCVVQVLEQILLFLF